MPFSKQSVSVSGGRTAAADIREVPKTYVNIIKIDV
jgi:hypothetical protein